MIKGASAIGALCRQATLRHHSQSQGAACRISVSVGGGVSGRCGMAVGWRASAVLESHKGSSPHPVGAP